MQLTLRCLLALAWLAAGAVSAQSAPTAALVAVLDKPPPSQALDAPEYRADAARHIYRSYRPLVHRGRLPAVLQEIAILETTVDADGAIEKIEVIREPASARVTPWIVALIQAAQPFPAAARQGKVVYRDTWLITPDGRFQLDSLSEGQAEQSLASKR